MQGEHSSQSSFFGMVHKELIPADQLLCKMAVTMDFSFVCKLRSDCYCPGNGHPS